MSSVILHYLVTIPSNLCTVNDWTISHWLHNLNGLFTANMCCTTVKHAVSRRHIAISLHHDVTTSMTLRHFYKGPMRSRYDVSSPSLIRIYWTHVRNEQIQKSVTRTGSHYKLLGLWLLQPCQKCDQLNVIQTLSLGINCTFHRVSVFKWTTIRFLTNT